MSPKQHSYPIALTVPELETIIWALGVAERQIARDLERTNPDKRSRLNWLTNRKHRVAHLQAALQIERQAATMVDNLVQDEGSDR